MFKKIILAVLYGTAAISMTAVLTSFVPAVARESTNLDMPKPNPIEIVLPPEMAAPEPPQTHIFAALDANNAFTGNETHTGTETFATLHVTGNLTSGITGLTQCIHANSSGLFSGTGVDCSSTAIHSFGTTFGDSSAASALTSGSVVYFTIPYACTIQAWNITVDAGTVTFDIWKIATGTAIPTVSNTITASALPALSTGTAKHSTTLTGWTTSVAANDIFGIDLNTVATAKYAELDLQCQ